MKIIIQVVILAGLLSSAAFSGVTGKAVQRYPDGRFKEITYYNDNKETAKEYFEEKGGVIKSRNWHDFSAQGLYELLQKAKPELAGSRKVFDADIACLKGNIFSPEVTEGRPYIKELCLAVAPDEFELHIRLNLGKAEAVMYAADLTEDYVEFNKGDVSDPGSLGG